MIRALAHLIILQLQSNPVLPKVERRRRRGGSEIKTGRDGAHKVAIDLESHHPTKGIRVPMEITDSNSLNSGMKDGGQGETTINLQV